MSASKQFKKDNNNKKWSFGWVRCDCVELLITEGPLSLMTVFTTSSQRRQYPCGAVQRRPWAFIARLTAFHGFNPFSRILMLIVSITCATLECHCWIEGAGRPELWMEHVYWANTSLTTCVSMNINIHVTAHGVGQDRTGQARRSPSGSRREWVTPITTLYMPSLHPQKGEIN